MSVQERLGSDLQATAVDDAAWPAFLINFAEQLGATEVTLGGAYPGRLPEMVAPMTDPGLIDVYRDTYHQQNALMRTVLQQQAGTLTMTEGLPEFESFSRSDLYNLWCVPQGFNHAVALSLDSSTGWRGAMVVNTKTPVTTSQMEQLQAFAPDLRRAVEQWRVLEHMRVANRLTLETLDMAGMGALFVDRTGRVLDCNHTAQSMLADGRLPMRRGQISSLEAQSEQALARMMARCLALPDEGGGRVQVMGKFGPVSVQCAPVPADLAFAVPQRPSMIVLVSDPQHKLRQRMGELMRAFGLTRAEAELAIAVVQTGSRKLAAEARGVSDATARSQLTSIFDKTGVRRQTELVRLLMDEN